MKKKPMDLKLFLLLVSGFVRRLFVVLTSRGYDIIFIHREVAPVFSKPLDIMLSMKSSRIIYDFDDAVFSKPSQLARVSARVRSKKSPLFWCRKADAVTAGNSFLYEYAHSLNKRVFLIPTSVDLDAPAVGRVGPLPRIL